MPDPKPPKVYSPIPTEPSFMDRVVGFVRGAVADRGRQQRAARDLISGYLGLGPQPDPRTAPRETAPYTGSQEPLPPEEHRDPYYVPEPAPEASPAPAAPPEVTPETQATVRSLPALMAFVETHGFDALPEADQAIYLQVIQALQAQNPSETE